MLMQEKQINIIRYSDNGVLIERPPLPRRGGSGSPPPSKRGKVVGFSFASARRLRRLLWSVDWSGAWSLCLTVPDLEQASMGLPSAEECWCKLQNLRPAFLRSLIWRKEVQRNGNSHYHCLLWPAEGIDGLDCCSRLIDQWIEYASQPRKFAGMMSADDVERLLQFIKAKMAKAHRIEGKRACCKPCDGGYRRYLADHQSKHKAYQANTVGRAWGVWQRRALPMVISFADTLSNSELLLVARALRKASRYRSPAPCPFGYHYASGGRNLRPIGETNYFGKRSDALAADVARYLALVRRWANPIG